MLYAKNFKIGCAILKLAANFEISNLRSAVLKLRKFATCVEYIYNTVHLYNPTLL